MDVKWTTYAANDLISIENHIARDSIPYSLVVVDRILGRVLQLEAFPESGSIVPEYELFAFGIGWTSLGILFQNQRQRRIGIFCSGASVLCYVVCVAFAITMRILYPDTFPFGRGPN